jgi:NAD(P)H-hydrate epimerase
MLIGPGLGDAKETFRAVQIILSKCDRPVVIDADAITAVGEKRQCIKNCHGVLTPHLEEFHDLTGKRLDEDFQKRTKHVMWAAHDLKFTIILKGPIDIITDGTNTKLNRTGNPAMTVGGTGDVLAGIVGGLLAKDVRPYEAARIGAFSSGFAGDLAYTEKSYGMVATDVIEKLPELLRQFVKQ